MPGIVPCSDLPAVKTVSLATLNLGYLLSKAAAFPRQSGVGKEDEYSGFVSPGSRTELLNVPCVGTCKGLDKNHNHFRPCLNTHILYSENTVIHGNCISYCKQKAFLNYQLKHLFQCLLYIFTQYSHYSILME